MGNLTFDWQIGEYMVYCRSRQLREKTMNSYEQTLRLFERCASRIKQRFRLIGKPDPPEAIFVAIS